MNGSLEEKEKQEAHVWRVVETRGYRREEFLPSPTYCHVLCVMGLRISSCRPETSPSVQMGSVCHRCQPTTMVAAVPATGTFSESFWKVLKAWHVPEGQEGKMLDLNPQPAAPRI